MKIGIDGRGLIGKKTGVSRYLGNLLKNLLEIDKENIYRIYLPSNSPLNIEINSSNLEKKIIKFPIFQNNITWTHIRLPMELFFNKVDLFHSPSYILPFLRNCKSMVSILDLSYELHPEWYPLKSQQVRLFSYLSAKTSNKIITISESVKEEIIKIYKIKEEKIEVIYLGVDGVFNPINKEFAKRKIKEKFNINNKFILYVGWIHTRRNIERLLKAFKKVKNEIPEKYNLVLIGTIIWPYINLNKLLYELNLKEDVTYIDYVSDEDLVLLYNAAELFIYPSLYEGFGLPLLEAMACGCPVVTSNLSSLPEVVRDAGYLINPYDEDEIAKAMLEILKNENLKENLIKKGLERIKKFSWRKTAEETLEVYKEVLD